MIKKKTHTFQKIKLFYYITGASPKLLITTGVHGDEYEIVPFIESACKRYEKRLPPFLFIPALSPSALKQKTRCNKDGVDANRHYLEHTTIKEVRAAQTLLQAHRFSLAVTFHEDVTQSAFYLYDAPGGKNLSTFSRLTKTLSKLHVPLFNGIDDPYDPVLGHLFIDGYRKISEADVVKTNGPFEIWLLNRGVAKRVITPEVPGKTNKDIKSKVVEAIFEHIILNYKY